MKFLKDPFVAHIFMLPPCFSAGLQITPQSGPYRAHLEVIDTEHSMFL